MHLKMKKTALIILNYNNVEDTINCIESVLTYNTALVKFIVVDNGSTRRDAVEILHEFISTRFCGRYIRLTDSQPVPGGILPDATLLVSATNDGYAQGNNKGLALASDDSQISDVMILNNDILFIEDIIPGLLAAREKLPDCGLISPLLLKRDCKNFDYNCARRAIKVSDLVCNHLTHYFKRMLGRTDEQSFRKRYILLDKSEGALGEVLPVDLPSGSCMLISKSLFARIGNFDPGTFLYYEEDILYRKLSDAGRHNYLVSGLRCVHLGAASTSQRGTPVTLRANIESERYYVKYFSGVTAPMKWLHALTSRFFWLSMQLQKKVCPEGLHR